MKPALFDYHRPASVAEATELLSGLEGEARPLAGGQSLVPLMNLRMSQPDHLIDLNGIAELATVRLEGDVVVTGAMVRQRALIEDADITRRLPLLSEAVAWIGHTHIRNRGTVGGSLAHADPSAELPAIAVVLDAELVVLGRSGKRTINAADFFVGHFTTVLEADELLIEIRWPAAGSGWGFRELARRHGDFATVLAAVSRRTDGSWRVVVGSVGSVPVRITAAELALGIDVPDEGRIVEAMEATKAECQPLTDVHASAGYRTAMAAELVGASLRDAWERCDDR